MQNEVLEVPGVDSVPDLDITACPKEETGGINHDNVEQELLSNN